MKRLRGSQTLLFPLYPLLVLYIWIKYTYLFQLGPCYIHLILSRKVLEEGIRYNLDIIVLKGHSYFVGSKIGLNQVLGGGGEGASSPFHWTTGVYLYSRIMYQKNTFMCLFACWANKHIFLRSENSIIIFITAHRNSVLEGITYVYHIHCIVLYYILF